MMKLLFSNRWIALFWVLTTLASVAMFVGKNGAAEQLSTQAKQVRAEQNALADGTMEPRREIAPEPEESPALSGFTEPDPSSPEGEVFVNPQTGEKVRIVRQSAAAEAGSLAPGD